ncbi:MAG: ABC transporter ATP-binding protein [Verrucomicrobia bacterium]|nr:ABC transporter ATP-binding protein [Verrucomicrobiota bacterium]
MNASSAEFAAPPRPAASAQETAVPKPESRRSDSALWRLLEPYVSQSRGRLLLMVLLNALPGLGIAVQTVTPKYLVDAVLLPPDLSPGERALRLALVIGAWLVAALGLRMLAWYASFRLFTKLREAAVRDLRSRCFRHIQHLCLRFHGQTSSGEMFAYVLGTPIASVSGFAHHVFINPPNAAAAFLLSSLWIFWWDWTLSLVLLALVLATVATLRRNQPELEELQESFQRTEARVSGRLSDLFRGQRDVKLHAAEEELARTFESDAATIGQATCRRDLHTHRLNMRHEVVGAVFFALVLLAGAWRFRQGGISTGELFTYLGAYVSLQGPVGLILSLGTQRATAETSARRLVELLEQRSSTPDPARPKPLPTRAELELEQVSFKYDNAGEPALAGVSVRIPFGQRVAIVGPSGAGKSTVIRLLLRLYDPDGGAVRRNGVDLRDCETEAVRRAFGVVPQEPYFFRDTNRTNLNLVSPEADEETLREVCRQANAWEFIERLPQGLDTVIGEGGCRLSGGQRQRLAIARALLNRPECLIFDEATSALDSLSAALIEEALERVLAHRTAIFIAHRLSTLERCQRILVLEGGRLVQDGTFEALSREEGRFRRLLQIELGGLPRGTER